MLRVMPVVAAVLAAGADAAPTPSSGTLTEAQPTLAYSGGPLATSPSGTATNACPDDSTSERFNLTVDLPADFDTRRPDDSLRIELAPVDTADTILTLRSSTGAVITSADNAATAVGETIQVDAKAGVTEYRVLVCVFAGGLSSYSVKISLVAAPAPPPPQPPLPGAPRLVTLVAPPAMGNSAGEPSIGYNLKSKRAMYIAGLQTLKVTPAESSGERDAAGAALPLACPATWTDVSTDLTGTISLDPILFTNQSLGEAGVNRTFVSQLTGANSAFAFTDDDGANWLPGQVGASNGGVDHQTVGAGAYPAANGAWPGPPPGNPGYAVYYCSQSIVDAFCARSDTGGQTFNNGVPIGKATALGCASGDIGGLHGHVRIALDGTLAMPMKSCAGQQAFIRSNDAGLTYSAKKVPGTTSGRTDPQLAWSRRGADNKIRGYLCMVDGDGKPKATVTSDKGETWGPLYDIGAAHGIKKAVFAQAIAGDADRAACAFVGTTTDGNSEALNFTGVWYGYVAYTFDGGANWTTLNVTPNDPVQGAGGICTSGTTCGSNRNLLDFNEITLDERGRVWFGYADGCTSAACLASGGASNDFADKATIARQIGGRSLYAAFDPEVAVIPQPPCLSGARNAAKASLQWVTPDDGGKLITGYEISRATAVTGPYVVLATIPAKNVFDDLTADAEVPAYFYQVRATYDGGFGLYSNILELPITVAESVCRTPGLTVLTDAANDPLDGQPSHDVRAISMAQPWFEGGDYKIYFHLKMTSLNPPTENTVWPINFCAPSFPCVNPDVNTAPYSATNKWFTVQMSTRPPATSATPAFELFIPTAAGTTTGSRTLKTLPASGGSNFTPAGLITMVVNASDLGLAEAGRGTDKLTKFQSRIGVNIGAGTITPDNVPDGLAGAGEFGTVAPSVCAPNVAPLAELQADVETGPSPLTVTFTGIGTDPDSIDTVDTYSLDFGDGSAPVAQDNGSFAPHTYSAIGNYPARLFVVDSRGQRSSNTAEKVIVVYGEPTADAGADFGIDEGESALLSGAGSDAANAGPLSYLWTQQAGPTAALNDADTATPSFVAPQICADSTLTFNLTVANIGGGDTDSVSVFVKNIILDPVANAGADARVYRDASVVLDGSASTHDPCLTVTYAWTQTQGPPVALSGAATATPSFVAPDVKTDTLLTFRLTMTDGAGNVTSDEVSVIAMPFLGDNAVGAWPRLTLLILGLVALLRRRPG